MPPAAKAKTASPSSWGRPRASRRCISGVYPIIGRRAYEAPMFAPIIPNPVRALKSDGRQLIE